MLHSFPLLIVRYEQDIMFPNTSKVLEVKRGFNVDAINVAITRFNGQIVVVSQKEEDLDDPNLSNILEVGCLCNVEVLEKIEYNDGSVWRIQLEGAGRFKIGDASFKVHESLSMKVKVWIATVSPLITKVGNVIQCKNLLIDYLEKNTHALEDVMDKEFAKMLDSIQSSDEDFEIMVDRIANFLPDQDHFKKRMICEPDLLKRVKYISDIVLVSDDIKKDVDQKVNKKVSRNISKQQKEFYLREKLKVIKEELGDFSSKDLEVKRFRDKLLKGKFPKVIAEKINEEIKRFEFCSLYSNESTVIRAYLDWLLNVPWEVTSEDQKDLKKVKEILDSNHCGLEKIKERILEYIAVRKKSNKEKGTIMCLVGPPGVGKTSLAMSIAQALNKKFVKISLGGLYDEAEIRGHRKTYVASMPGRIIRSLRQVQVKNPVFLLDEIDKIANGYHGDPVHALLEILDPKQNRMFNDHYLEEDFDLSQVMFIATANYEENIPEPLLDRMEMIYLRTYTDNEKMHIAKSHLIPEVLNECGLSSDELVFEDDAILFIIQRYTKEAGVRNLKQSIDKITRKFVKRQIMKELSNQIIGKDEVKEYLEYEIYDYTKADDEGIPGVVNGMAYTDFGGDLLPIEVNYVSGKGNLSLTGNLKDTMKESASVALAYVRANEETFGLKDVDVDWNNIDINLHVPSGGIPKDGPSAGVTITTALISSFSGRAVSPKIAMTGEITLRGKVLPIGGIKEKVVSAVRGGVNTIFYPDENTKNLIDIPEEIRSKIDLIPVKNYQDIYDKVFVK